MSDSTKSAKKEAKRKAAALEAEGAAATGDSAEASAKSAKKAKKAAAAAAAAAASEASGATAADKEKEKEDKDELFYFVPDDAISPIANPLAGKKLHKKIFKVIKKSSKARSLQRGVKEVVKTLRKPSPSAPLSKDCIVILAANISPPDVLSHLPVLCEDAGVPYCWVRSKEELGAAAGTKRPTSVVLVRPNAKVRKPKDGETAKPAEKLESFQEIFDEARAEIKSLDDQIVY